MRHLIAALLVCVATAVAHGAAKNPPLFSVASSSESSKNGGTTPVPSGRKALPPATEGQNFYNSFIGPKGPFVWIQPGTFLMGSNKGTDPDKDLFDEEQHSVTLTRGFWILDHEVTQWEYLFIMGKPSNSKFKGEDLPVEQISWYDAYAFCDKLTKLDRQMKRIREDQKYRLPTEAEWEYAARAGTTGARYTVDGKNVIDSLDLIAWGPNWDPRTKPVKTKKPNAWGLYDMIGNVAEWCEDYYDDYPTWPVTDPIGLRNRGFRVFRGGSIDSQGSRGLRAASRLKGEPQKYGYFLGFRLALSSVR
jgi:formylglycine-generating enzyme required for sulfatase activity